MVGLFSFWLPTGKKDDEKPTGYESYKYKITKVSHNHKNSQKITIMKLL
jgi:hypothetical protein